MNKKISKELFMSICGKKYSNRHGKKLDQRILPVLYAFIEKTIHFDENGKIEEGIDIDKLLDEFDNNM